MKPTPIWLLVLVALWLISWRIEKWINWKFAYEPRVRSEIVQIKARLDRLERGVTEWDVPTNRFESITPPK